MKNILLLLLLLIPSIGINASEISGWVDNFCSFIDTTLITGERKEIEDIYKFMDSAEATAGFEAITYSAVCVNMACRLGKYEDVKRHVQNLPTANVKDEKLQKWILIALANYSRFLSMGFEHVDKKYQTVNLGERLPSEITSSNEYKYLQCHQALPVQMYDTCEMTFGGIAKDVINRDPSSKVELYELEACLYWIETLLDSGRYEFFTEGINACAEIFSRFEAISIYYRAWYVYLYNKYCLAIGASEGTEATSNKSLRLLEQNGESISPVYAMLVKQLGIIQMANGNPAGAFKSFDKYGDIVVAIYGEKSWAEWDACIYAYDTAIQLKYNDIASELQKYLFGRMLHYSRIPEADSYYLTLRSYKLSVMDDIRRNDLESNLMTNFSSVVDGYADFSSKDVDEYQSLLNLCGYVNVLQGKYECANKYFSEYLEIERKYAHDVFSFLPELLRFQYWGKRRSSMNKFFALNRNGVQSLNDNAIEGFSIRNNKDITANVLYDGALLNKGIMLQASVNLQKILTESGDENLKNLIKEQAKTGRIQRSSRFTKEQTDRAIQIEYQLIKESKKYGDFMNFANLKWQDVKEKLKDNEVAVEFVSSTDRGTEYYSAEIIRKEFSNPKHIFLFSCKEGDTLFDQADIYDSNLLNNMVWAKILKYVRPQETIYFSPAGMLYGVAIENAMCGESGRLSTLYNPVRLSSTREILKKQNDSCQGNIVLYGGLDFDMSTQDMKMVAQSSEFRGGKNSGDSDNDRVAWNFLPGSYDEVEEISSLLIAGDKNNVKVYTGMEGTEESFKRNSGKPVRILHIATHGYSLKNQSLSANINTDYITADNSMLNSALILSGGNNGWLYPKSIPEGVEDGILTAKEIASLDFSGTDLVVLSACQTGLGSATGEGVYGLQRAFKLAGAQTIVMSLAEVHDDATKLLMTQFYSNLSNGLSKREAFSKAQEAVKDSSFTIDDKSVSGSDPRFWAPFVILD